MGHKRKTKDDQYNYISTEKDRHFARLYEKTADCENFRSLSFSAQMLYMRMILASNGKVVFEYPFSEYKNFFSKDCFLKARNQLEEKGFITVNKTRTIKARYTLSDNWKTNDCKRKSV